ncbi:unnamed protein product [Brachionus calyciflorus]|uniref:Alpha/beta hydrolase fold-3 domain-containing protein n=1 Tax=Brachionus calyciflorus TaxID=104777 RepID=A0A814B4K2_9BILA|nr:unnamed protein product [Brachionus calyciflorus]
MRIVVKLAKLASFFGFQYEPILIRELLKIIIKPHSIIPENLSSVNIINDELNSIRIRIYSPKTNTDNFFPAMIYFHGGGYVLNSIDTYHSILLKICHEAQIVIITFDYPLAPENKYPIPIEECSKMTNYLLTNLDNYNLNIDFNRIVLAGDSAGANITITVSNQLKEKNECLPKLQILINPPTQFFNMLMPCMIKYSSFEKNMPREKLILWHMGFTNIKEYHSDFLIKNYHTLLVDETLRAKYMTYTDFNLIPEKYKKDLVYYQSYEKIIQIVYPKTMSKDYERLDENFKSCVKNIFNVNISPGLADDIFLSKQPQTFITISEWDTRKDEGLIYAQRLSNNGVKVDIGYYENGFHTSFLNQDKAGCDMINDVISYLKENV